MIASRCVPPEKWRNPEYREWAVDSFPCDVCGNRGAGWLATEFAHGPVNGTGSKGPDAEGVILCHGHHATMHRIGWTMFEQSYNFHRAAVATEHWERFVKERECCPQA
jgi:hypothetical protein